MAIYLCALKGPSARHCVVLPEYHLNMRPIPPLNKWVVRSLYLLGGYVLKWWLSAEEARASAGSDDEQSAPSSRLKASRRRPPPPAEELKLVLVVNDSLKMSKGKIGKNPVIYFLWCPYSLSVFCNIFCSTARNTNCSSLWLLFSFSGAQCAHAAVGMVEELHEKGQHTLLAQWEDCGQPKICLKAKDDADLKELSRAAAAVGLTSFQVQDAGRTQVAAGSRTVLAIGPAPKSVCDKVTGHLRLLWVESMLEYLLELTVILYLILE